MTFHCASWLSAWWRDWLARHQHPTSRLLHAFAVPLLPAAGVLAAVQLVRGEWGLWWRPVLLLVVSYAVQWLGHHVEGNDMGEVILIKRLLGKPYVAVAPPRPKDVKPRDFAPRRRD